MRNVITIFVFVLLSIACDNSEDIDSVLATEAKILINEESQILLEPSTIPKEEIEDLSCGDAKISTLFAGQHINIGTVTVFNDEVNLYVSYNLKGNWWLNETHLYVGSENKIPYNNGGNPKIGHFPYHGDHGVVKNYIFTIPLENIEECIVVISHAEVIQKNNNEIVGSESAFGYGENEFPGNRWGWTSDYCQQECTEECIDAFGKVNEPLNSYCFSFKDLDNKIQWAWSNEFIFNELFIYQEQGSLYRYPIYANDPSSCDGVEEHIIGYVQMEVSAGDGRLFTDIKYVITDSNYLLHQISYYLGAEKFPFDDSGNINDNVDKEDFKVIILETPVSEYLIKFQPWPALKDDKAFMIPHVAVCLSEASIDG